VPRTAFRRATAADIAVYRTWFADAELARRLSPPTPDWERYIETPSQAFWVALDTGDRIVAGLQTERDENGDTWLDCAIDPARRGTGRMGTILADFMAGPAHGERLIAEVEPDNAASLALLRRSGFEPAGGPASDGLVRFVRKADQGPQLKSAPSWPICGANPAGEHPALPIH
jgi:RimJ/RimL family protein N-acetyltransferase